MTPQGKFLTNGNFISHCDTPDKKKTLWWHTCQIMNLKQNHMQVITCKSRIKYVALLNVLFYKWLSYPAGISGWHCAAVTTTISPTHACLSMGAPPQKSNVRCYPSPLIEKDPPSGALRPCFLAGDGKTPLLSSFGLERGGWPWRPYC